MTTAKQVRNTARLWASSFQTLLFGNNFLLRKHGPVVFGICLNGTGDRNRYAPSFFVHNLLSGRDWLSLSYHVDSTNKKGVSVDIKYETDVVDVVRSIKENAFILNSPAVTFEDCLKHILFIVDKCRGQADPYLPHTLFDIITLGCYVGHSDYFLHTLTAAAEEIKRTGNINIHITGSVEEWIESVKKAVLISNEDYVDKISSLIGLPELVDHGLPAGNCEIDYLSKV